MTDAQDKATPRPWWVRLDDQEVTLVGADGRLIANTNCSDVDDHEHEEANAALIVSAVNERDGLLKCKEALEAMCADYDDLISETVAAVCWKQADGTPDRTSATPHDLEGVTAMEAIRAKASEALSLLSQAQGNSDSTGIVTVDRFALPHRKGE